MTILEFENTWTEKIKTELLKNFPSDFITNINCDNLNMPGKSLVKGPELFGNFEIIDTAGETFAQTDNIYKLKYILYSNRNTPENIAIPVDENELKVIVKFYEEHIDELIKTVEKNFRQTFQSSKEFHTTSNKIFTSLNLSRY
ncbi:MAG: hypothetical protein GY936_01655 [Ignavibacteriae bacterium]|nr:hypothetical protein [Ignavibacteriota bacterium]